MYGIVRCLVFFFYWKMPVELQYSNLVCCIKKEIIYKAKFNSEISPFPATR